MIIDEPQSHFIYVCHPNFLSASGPSYLIHKGKQLTNKEYLEHWGKWLILDDKERLDELATTLDPYVERKEIPIIKYDRVPPQNLGGQSCVMLVFCDDRDREEVWQILSEIGITLKAWFYDKQTMELWMPGGMLLENWLTEQGIEGEKAEAIREDIRLRFKSLYGTEDALCRGWEIDISPQTTL